MRTIHDLGHGFWNIRSVFRLGGILDIGSQASLVRLRTGRFVILDSCGLSDAAQAHLLALTDGGHAVEAILNLHPFHTRHCADMAALFPDARLYGSVRHMRHHPDLPWEQQTVESPEIAARYAEDLDFSLPRGIDYISENSRIHAGSLLVRHPASRTVHVDDTLNVIPTPKSMVPITSLPELIFHPATVKALQGYADAPQNFRDWVHEIQYDWEDTRIICAAHSGILHLPDGGFAAAIGNALARLEPKLAKIEAGRGLTQTR